MISFKTKEDFLPSTLILLSLVVLTGALVFMLLVPEPSTADIVSNRKATIRKLSEDVLYSKHRADEARNAVEPRLWMGSQNHVSAAVLGLVTASSTEASLKLTAFRPQRTVDLDGITELPFTVQISGTFADIRQVMRSLDGPHSRVVLCSVAVNASEEVTNTVQATLVISAYVASPTSQASTTEANGNDNAQA
jgi:hypothetical protein